MGTKDVLRLCLLFVGFTFVFVVRGEPCKDVSPSICKLYGQEYCFTHRPFMERRCKQFCGFCDCKNWKYGCCRDRKTPAAGPGKKGCPRLLCFDMWPKGCRDIKRSGKCEENDNAEKCAWSCGTCKSAAPTKQCKNPRGFGCCWDGTPALGPNGRGCRPCVDASRHVCNQFVVFDHNNKVSCGNTGAWYTRNYLEKACPKTCKRCPEKKCEDVYKGNQCSEYVANNWCNEPIVKLKMQLFCRKSCGFCSEP